MSEELSRAGEPMFTLVRRGYDPVEVDGYVSQLHHQLRGLQKPDQAVIDALEKVGAEVADILKQAHDTARNIVETAEQSAAETKKNADEHAANIVAAAEKRLQDIDIDTDRVWAERARIINDVRDLSKQLSGVADLAEQRFPDEATGELTPVEPFPEIDTATTEFPLVREQDTAEYEPADEPADATEATADEAATDPAEAEPDSDSELEPAAVKAGAEESHPD